MERHVYSWYELNLKYDVEKHAMPVKQNSSPADVG